MTNQDLIKRLEVSLVDNIVYHVEQLLEEVKEEEKSIDDKWKSFQYGYQTMDKLVNNMSMDIESEIDCQLALFKQRAHKINFIKNMGSSRLNYMVNPHTYDIFDNLGEDVINERLSKIQEIYKKKLDKL